MPAIPLGTPIPTDTGATLTVDWFGYMGLLPILTPWAVDEDFVGPSLPIHVHVDWRFVTDKNLLKLKMESAFRDDLVLAKVMTWTYDKRFLRYLQPTLHRLTCLREMPPLPTLACKRELEELYACAALRDGKCPHRGTPVEQMIDVGDGTLICPAHGLRWNARTGALVPR